MVELEPTAGRKHDAPVTEERGRMVCRKDRNLALRRTAARQQQHENNKQNVMHS